MLWDLPCLVDHKQYHDLVLLHLYTVLTLTSKVKSVLDLNRHRSQYTKHRILYILFIFVDWTAIITKKASGALYLEHQGTL